MVGEESAAVGRGHTAVVQREILEQKWNATERTLGQPGIEGCPSLIEHGDDDGIEHRVELLHPGDSLVQKLLCRDLAPGHQFGQTHGVVGRVVGESHGLLTSVFWGRRQSLHAPCAIVTKSLRDTEAS